MKPRTCFVPRCKHQHEDGWTHVAPVRQTPVTAHLRLARTEVAA